MRALYPCPLQKFLTFSSSNSPVSYLCSHPPWSHHCSIFYSENTHSSLMLVWASVGTVAWQGQLHLWVARSMMDHDSLSEFPSSVPASQPTHCLVCLILPKPISSSLCRVDFGFLPLFQPLGLSAALPSYVLIVHLQTLLTCHLHSPGSLIKMLNESEPDTVLLPSVAYWHLSLP